MHKFHLVKERFLWDDYDSGLYFDLFPLKRKAGEDEDGFNVRIEAACKALDTIEPEGNAYLPTLFLTQGQIDKLPLKYQGMYSGKSYLMVFKGGYNGEALPKNMWFEQMGGGLVCNPTGLQKNWVYWSSWGDDGKELGHRFRRVTKAEVDEFPYDEPVITPPPADDPHDDPVNPGDSVITIPARIDLHIWHHEGKPEV